MCPAAYAVTVIPENRRRESLLVFVATATSSSETPEPPLCGSSVLPAVSSVAFSLERRSSAECCAYRTGTNAPKARSTSSSEKRSKSPSAERARNWSYMNIMPILCTGSVAYTLHAMPSVPNA